MIKQNLKKKINDFNYNEINIYRSKILQPLYQYLN